MERELNQNRLNLKLYKTSSIGTSVLADEDELKVKYYFTIFSWILTLTGTTRMPYRIDFTCLMSGELFESLSNKELISHFMLYRTK